jgi:hypothetical protein
MITTMKQHPSAAEHIDEENHKLFEEFDKVLEVFEGMHTDLESKLIQHIQFLDAVNQGKVDADQQKIDDVFRTADQELRNFEDKIETAESMIDDVREIAVQEVEELEKLASDEVSGRN